MISAKNALILCKSPEVQNSLMYNVLIFPILPQFSKTI